jgi:formamidopyrimidine-DNA glycosylase
MPELPEVEGFRKVFESCATGRTVRRVEVRDAGVLHGVSARGLADALDGRRFAEPERRGKWLLARTDDGPTLVVHFGMTGRLVCADAEDAVERHDRVVFGLDSGHQLRYRDQRKLKGLWLAHDEAGVERVLGPLGPDALAVGRGEFEDAFASRRGQIKSALTDQSVLAGLGNLLADEILWRSRFRPDHQTRELTQADRTRLYSDMRSTLRRAVEAGCVPTRDSWLTGHRDDPDPVCPRCGNPLRRTRLAGRTAVWCPHDQK